MLVVIITGPESQRKRKHKRGGKQGDAIDYPNDTTPYLTQTPLQR